MEKTNGLITIPPATGGSSCRGAAHGSRTWLGGWRGWAIAGVVITAGISLALSQHWLAIANLVPLVFVLPCMAMMFICMKGMNHGQQTDSTTTRASAGEGTPTATDPRN